MYITNGLYSPYAEYLDINDIKFFHHTVELAKERYFNEEDRFSDMSKSELSKLKSSEMLVIYASTVSNFSNDDILISRPEMNERARRKYLIIDADFDSGEEDKSEKLKEDLQKLASDFNTPIIIYPTASYPSKPRFRAVLFVKNALNESSYYQAMTWLYTMLGSEPNDSSDLKIRSNNNAPFFINREQIDFIYDTTQIEGLEPLNNVLWKTFPKPKIKSLKPMKKSQFDEFTIPEESLKKACLEFAKSESAKYFSSFWRVLHSLARAEFFEQLSPELVDKALMWVAQVPGDSLNSARWSIENKQQYKNERRRVFSNEKILLNARPLIKIKEFGQVFLEDDLLKFDEE